MKARKVVLTVGFLVLLTPIGAAAQALPVTLEVRAGVGIPTGDFADAASTGFGFEINAAYRVMTMIDVYAGFSRHSFNADDEELGDVDLDVNDDGFSLGALVTVPGVPGLAPWLRGGLLFHRAELTGREGGFAASARSDWSLGFELGGGVAVPLTANLSLTPGVRYRQYTATFDFGEEGDADADVTYVAADLGLRLRF